MKTTILALLASAAIAFPAYAQSTSTNAASGSNSNLNSGLDSGVNGGSNLDMNNGSAGSAVGNSKANSNLTTNSITGMDQPSKPLANPSINTQNMTYGSKSTGGTIGNQAFGGDRKATSGSNGQSQSMAGKDQDIRPNRLSRQQIRQIQEALNKDGFDAGHVDGIWGPHTRTALKNFQTARNMASGNASSKGRLDEQTLSALGLNPQQFAMARPGRGMSGNSVNDRTAMNGSGTGGSASRSGADSLSTGSITSQSDDASANSSGANAPGSQSAMNGKAGNASQSQDGISSEQTGSIPSQNFDLQAFQSAQVSLDQAVNTAKGKLNGQVIGASFTKDNGQPAFRVRAFNSSSNKVEQAMIDAKSGQMIGNVSPVSTSELDRQEQQAASAASNPQTSLTQAVQAATQQSNGGKAVQAMLTQENGQPAYAVTVASNGSTQTFQVDAQSGKVQPMNGSGSQGNGAAGQSGNGG